MFTIYCYTNKINGKKYIGITSRSMKERENSHIYETKEMRSKNFPFKRALMKYGIENFNLEILEQVETKEEACQKEIFYIKKYKTYYKFSNSNGYNATIGGEFLSRPKDRVIQVDKDDLDKITICESAADLRKNINKKIYDAIKKNSITNNSFWYYEKEFDKEKYKEDIYIKHNYICQIDIESLKLIKIWSSSSVAGKEKGYSQGLISSCTNGDRHKHANCYWTFYSNYILNIYDSATDKSNNSKRKIVQYSLNGEYLKTWDSLTQISDNLKINISLISKCCSTYGSSNGYIWRYLDNNINIFKPKGVSIKTLKCDLNWNIIKEYDSCLKASKDIGFSTTCIQKHIKNQKPLDGYLYKKE